ncbi:MAG: NAD(P)H-dependent oxidoreductase [Opitutales bacterium]|nr:NAD(P)H-dependent oxidoreductase [Opitutales bacterium]
MICILSGTNRPGNNSLKVATLLKQAYENSGESVTLLDLQKLPPEIFSPAAYGDKPEAFTQEFSGKILEASGLHLVVGEYNGSFPGVLKYFIDMLPFPDAFEGRPTAFTGLAAGAHGGIRAVEQLQQVFGYRNAYIYPKRVFIPFIFDELIDQETLKSEDLQKRLQQQASGFLEFTRALHS